MNSSKLYFSLILFSGFFALLYPQTEQQIQQRLKQEGISTKADVTEELKKRNMTEDDARRLAKQYGMDYDAFIATYILSGSTTPLPPAVSNVTNTPDTSAKKHNKHCRFIRRSNTSSCSKRNNC